MGQANLLAGLVNAPTAHDPLTHLALARQRQRQVLDRLAAVGTLSRAAADDAYRSPLGLITGQEYRSPLRLFTRRSGTRP